MYRILVLATIALILGILTVTTDLLLFTLLFIGGLTFYCLFFLSTSPYRPAVTIIFFLFCYAVGAGRTFQVKNMFQQLPPGLGQNVTLTLQICAEPQRYSNRCVYITKIKDSSYKGKILVSVAGQGEPSYEYGDIMLVKGRLELPERAKNPGEFNYREYLRRQGITGQINIWPENITLVGRSILNPLLSGAILAKERVQKNVYQFLPETEANLFNSIFFGDKGLLSARQKEVFTQLGIMHIFAVSGSNVALVLIVLTGLAILLKLKTFRRNILLLSGLIFYAYLTGLTPSVMRATLMAASVILAEWLRRRRDFYTDLAASALILLIWNPYNLFDSGFQLSYLVTWGIMYLQPYFLRFFHYLPGWGTYLTVGITSQLAALPLTAYYFNMISLAALVINLFVVPVMGIIVNLGMFVFILTFLWSPLAAPFIYTGGLILTLLLRFLVWAGSLPYIAIKVATPNLLLVIASYLSLILLVELYHKKELKFNFLRPLTVVLCICVFISFLLPPPLHGKLEVTFIDVGQGDGIFVQTPQGKRFLIDGGGTNLAGTFNAGENIVVPYLTRRGIFKLDGVINTHPDSDHLAGLFPVIEGVKVAAVLTPPPRFFADGYQELGELLAKQNVSWKEGRGGQTLWLDDGRIKIEILHPGEVPVASGHSSDNDNSLVLKISYGNFSCLLTGDIEADGLEALLKQGGDFSCTVFKIPHHGSKYAFNQEFYLQADPEIVVFSVGQNNFGHPAPELIQYWEERNVAVYRTDYDGAVTFLTDGEKLEVMTMGRELPFYQSPDPSHQSPVIGYRFKT